MGIPCISVVELQEEDLSFLFRMWSIPEVMTYADEFPRLRGWSKSDQIPSAWEKYLTRRAVLGFNYTQLILIGANNQRIGESFFAPLEEGYTFGRWEKPKGVSSLMGDIKLLPDFWGQGLGTIGMRQVVRWFFDHTNCELIVVPPHRHNPAAEQVYQKAGFILFTGMRSWRNHKVMELTKERYQTLYQEKGMDLH
jgi:RimJ/RimL family protein N-acetyltransferase